MSDRMSPIQMYAAGGGSFANPRVAALLMEAERGHQKRTGASDLPTHEDWERRHQDDKEKQQRFLEHCRPAEPKEYSRWLKGYLRRGGWVTHPRNGPIRPHEFYMLESRPHSVPSLYGALSLNVIVPSGILGPRDIPRTHGDWCGHSSFFFMEGFEAVALVIESFADANGGIWKRG